MNVSLRKLSLLVLLVTSAQATHAQDNDSTGDSGSETAAAERETTEPVAEQPARRIIRISGVSKLDVRQWPLIGKPDAKYIFAEIFDYTCPHCRNAHQAVKGALERYGDDLAIVLLPIPLQSSCSVSTPNRNTGSDCQIARLSVAVWKAAPEKFREYHDWLMQQGRGSTEATQRAEQLIGRDALAEQLAGQLPQKYVAQHTKLYNRAGAGTVPKFMFPRQTITGVVGTDYLCETIERQLGGE